MCDSQGKVVLVTGGAKRVGAWVARRLHADGARLILHYRHARAEAEALAAELEAQRPDSVAIVHADLLDFQCFAPLAQLAAERFGRLDGLVNNASTFFQTPLGRIDEQAWDDLVGSNFKAPLFLTQAVAPFLRATHGAVVNIADVHGERPLAGYPLYSAAKGALLTLTRALAIELGPEVRVNAVAPGPVLWPDDGQFPTLDRSAIIEHTLLKRAGSPAEVAAVVRFLLAEATYMTGQILNVDGGRTAHL
jgi:pteridine reductase